MEGRIDSLTNGSLIWRQRGPLWIYVVGCQFRYLPHTNSALIGRPAGKYLWRRRRHSPPDSEVIDDDSEVARMLRLILV